MGCELKAKDIIQNILTVTSKKPQQDSTNAFAPINIALVKYWGKRNVELKLPMTSSFSMTIKELGTYITLTKSDSYEIFLNGDLMENDSQFSKRIIDYLKLFNFDCKFKIITKNTVPTSAGLASSSSGFSALVLALNDMFQWNFDKKTLSILSRIASGSACRSLYNGFTEWHKGSREDGMDSYATPYSKNIDDLCVTLLINDAGTKYISSSVAMQKSLESRYYNAWQDIVEENIKNLKQTIKDNDFIRFGTIIEQNSLHMHAICNSVGIFYNNDKTIGMINKIQGLRQLGVNIFFTQDAGPNLVVLYLKKDLEKIKKQMPDFPKSYSINTV